MLAGDERCDGIFEIMLGGGGTTFAEREVLVVDAAAIGDIAILIEDNGFGSDGDAGFFDEVMFRITQKWAGEMIVAAVCGDFRVGIGGVWIDEIEGDLVGRKFMGEAFEFGREFIGDRAIGADEYKNDDFGRRL